MVLSPSIIDEENLYKLQATDTDSGDFGRVRYSLYSLSDILKFSIASDTGIISLTSSFNRTVDSKYNNFTVIANDNPNSQPSNNASATVQV